MIEPGATFVVGFTPPRTGTFIYHTHLHDYRQLSRGISVAMIVVEPGERSMRPPITWSCSAGASVAPPRAPA